MVCGTGLLLLTAGCANPKKPGTTTTTLPSSSGALVVVRATIDRSTRRSDGGARTRSSSSEACPFLRLTIGSARSSPRPAQSSRGGRDGPGDRGLARLRLRGDGDGGRGRGGDQKVQRPGVGWAGAECGARQARGPWWRGSKRWRVAGWRVRPQSMVDLDPAGSPLALAHRQRCGRDHRGVARDVPTIASALEEGSKRLRLMDVVNNSTPFHPHRSTRHPLWIP